MRALGARTSVYTLTAHWPALSQPKRPKRVAAQNERELVYCRICCCCKRFRPASFGFSGEIEFLILTRQNKEKPYTCYTHIYEYVYMVIARVFFELHLELLRCGDRLFISRPYIIICAQPRPTRRYFGITLVPFLAVYYTLLRRRGLTARRVLRQLLIRRRNVTAFDTRGLHSQHS